MGLSETLCWDCQELYMRRKFPMTIPNFIKEEKIKRAMDVWKL